MSTMIEKRVPQQSVSDTFSVESLKSRYLPGFMRLCSVRTSGLLMLIDQLLDSKEKTVKKLKTDCILADRLLKTFSTIRVAVTPLDEEHLPLFISQILEQAKKILTSSNRYGEDLLLSAANLLKAFEACQRAEEAEPIFSELEKWWKAFSILLLQKKLQIYKSKEQK